MRQTDVKEIREIVRKYILDTFIKDNELTIDDDFSFIEEGVIDSVGVMEMVAFLETTFNFRVEDEELVPDNLDSVNKIVTYVDSKFNTVDS